MRIERHGITGEDLTYLTDIGWSEVDTNDPSEILMGLEDDIEGEEVELGGISGIPRGALKTIIQYLIPSKSSGSRKVWDVAKMRLAVLAHAAGVEGVGDKSLSALAEELGVSRALLSHYAIKLVDELGEAQVRGGKCRESRQVFRQAATNYHRRAGHKMREASQDGL